jgi:hypothetical protein
MVFNHKTHMPQFFKFNFYEYMQNIHKIKRQQQCQLIELIKYLHYTYVHARTHTHTHTKHFILN